MTYALETRSAGRLRSEVAVRKPLPVVRALKNKLRSGPPEATSYETRKLFQTREKIQRQDALEEMFLASRSRFLAIANSILRNRDDAEDALQEAFLSAYRHVHTFEGRSALKTWFTRIVSNVALMMLRKRKSSVVRLLAEGGASCNESWTENIPGAQPDPEIIYAERETLQFIDEKLEKLKPLLRQAFTMAYYDDLSVAEASAMLGVSCGTFKGRLFHARRKLLGRTGRAVVSPIRRVLKATLSHRVRASSVHRAVRR